MTAYAEGQVVKGKNPPKECPEGYYWRKVMGVDEFKLYPKHERRMTTGSTLEHLEDAPRLTVTRVAAGVRRYMQHQEGFKQVMEAAQLSAKALQNLAQWAGAAAAAKAEAERIQAAALAKASSALKEAGLMIGPDGKVQPIPVQQA